MRYFKALQTIFMIRIKQKKYSSRRNSKNETEKIVFVENMGNETTNLIRRLSYNIFKLQALRKRFVRAASRKSLDLDQRLAEDVLFTFRLFIFISFSDNTFCKYCIAATLRGASSSLFVCNSAR